MNLPPETIKRTADAIKKLMNPASVAPVGPQGLPATKPNQNITIEHHYDGEGIPDPGVIDGVTGTGGGAIIQ